MLTEKQKRRIGNARLMKLAGHLRQVHRFNYSRWVGADWRGAQDLSCGTTACALGWAATMKPFRRLGMRLHRDEEGLRGYIILVRPNEVTLRNFSAASEIFNLAEFEAVCLFSPAPGEANASAKDVACKIENWVRAHPPT